MNLTRQDFLMGCGAASLALGGCASGQAARSSAGSLKFCVFADIHYGPGAFPHDNREWLERILERARRERCDMILHLGDFCHKPVAAREYVDYYNNFPIPAYHTIGNHDDDGNSHAQTLEAYRLKNGYYTFDRGGFRFVILDTNYFERDGVFYHYSRANYHVFFKRDQADLRQKHRMSSTRLPPEQLTWFERTLAESPLPCIVASHASFERPGVCKEGPRVMEIINAANRAHPGRVRLVMNGHHHCDHVRILDNVIYFDVNSASYNWYSQSHDKYPADYKKRWRQIGHTIMWDDPISAIVTISPDGHLKVEGQKSRFHLGITPEMAGYPAANSGRLTTPEIQSFEI